MIVTLALYEQRVREELARELAQADRVGEHATSGALRRLRAMIEETDWEGYRRDVEARGEPAPYTAAPQGNGV